MDEFKNKFIFPGQYVGVVEETTAGKGTYEIDHEVFSMLAGRVIREHGQIEVIAKKEIVPIKPNQIIYGIVVDVMENLALIEIEPFIKGRERFVPAWDYGVLRVMNIREGYVPTAKTEVRCGDIIKAKVEEVSIGISLSTKEAELGVVCAYCSFCRTELVLYNNMLMCVKCKKLERRKQSKSYGSGVILNEIRI